MIVDNGMKEYFLKLIDKLDKENKLLYAMLAFMPRSIHVRLWFKDETIEEIEKEIKEKFKKEIVEVKKDKDINLLQITIIKKELVKIKI